MQYSQKHGSVNTVCKSKLCFDPIWLSVLYRKMNGNHLEMFIISVLDSKTNLLFPFGHKFKNTGWHTECSNVVIRGTDWLISLVFKPEIREDLRAVLLKTYSTVCWLSSIPDSWNILWKQVSPWKPIPLIWLILGVKWSLKGCLLCPTAPKRHLIHCYLGLKWPTDCLGAFLELTLANECCLCLQILMSVPHYHVWMVQPV